MTLSRIGRLVFNKIMIYFRVKNSLEALTERFLKNNEGEIGRKVFFFLFPRMRGEEKFFFYSPHFFYDTHLYGNTLVSPI